MIKTFLALGSNLKEPVNQVKTAIKEISQLPDTRLLQASSLYQTAPVGITDQPAFINAVIEVDTHLPPEALLAQLLALEKLHERVRTLKNGPRTLDIDILLYGQQIIKKDNLEIPHPRLTERGFVLLPLAEIAPSLVLPTGESISYWLQKVNSSPNIISKIQGE